MNKIIFILISLICLTIPLVYGWKSYQSEVVPNQARLASAKNSLLITEQKLVNIQNIVKDQKNQENSDKKTTRFQNYSYFDLSNESKPQRLADKKSVRVISGIMRLMHHSRVLASDISFIGNINSTTSVNPNPDTPPPTVSNPNPTPLPVATPGNNTPQTQGNNVTLGKIIKRAKIDALGSYGNITYLVERIKQLPPMIKVDSYDIKQDNSSGIKGKSCLKLNMNISITFFVS